MRLLKRNTVAFEYRAYLRSEDVLVNGLHTGNVKPVYDDPVYDVQAVRPTMNVLAVALRKRTKNHAPEGWQNGGD